MHSCQNEPGPNHIRVVSPYSTEAGPRQPVPTSSAGLRVLYSVGLKILTS